MAKFCTNCGATLDDDKKFCTECGAPVNESPVGAAAPPPPPPQSAPQPQAAPVYAQAATATMPPPQSAYQQATAYGGDVPPPKGSKYEPITTKGFIGIMLLMCIPVVGQILMIIWALGGCRKINKRNLARASLIMMVVAL
ncbi:MAG: zinc ribbon domain-containing protein, partial [Oscillospiraceae bacterium]|nr:zinc ribbon domain-containing protein [Oscillospiraceae bacterium]